MIDFSYATQYFKYNGFRFVNTKGPYYIVYLSENSNFLNDKKRLNLFYLDFKDIIINNTSFPRTYLTGKLTETYRKSQLIAHKNYKQINEQKNIIFEPNIFFKKIDKVYNEYHTYRNHYNGTLIYNEILKAFNNIHKNYRKIFMYAVDVNKCHKDYNNRKIFLFLDDLKHKKLFFDDFVMVLFENGKTTYKILIKNREYDYNRIFNYIRYLK